MTEANQKWQISVGDSVPEFILGTLAFFLVGCCLFWLGSPYFSSSTPGSLSKGPVSLPLVSDKSCSSLDEIVCRHGCVHRGMPSRLGLFSCQPKVVSSQGPFVSAHVNCTNHMHIFTIVAYSSTLAEITTISATGRQGYIATKWVEMSSNLESQLVSQVRSSHTCPQYSNEKNPFKSGKQKNLLNVATLGR